MQDDISINDKLVFGFEHLMLPVNFDNEFTLRDVLRACVNSKIPMDVLCPILHCSYIPQYWAEAEDKPFDEDDRDIEYLEIYWWGSKSTWEGKREDGSTWSFHGMGREGEIPQDIIDHYDEKEIAKLREEGYRQAYAVEFTPIYNLADYPIKLSNKLHITDYDADPRDNMDMDVDMTPSITLIELLYGIFWELSFLGSPEERDEKNEDLMQRVQDIKDGKVEMIPWEDVKERLKDKFSTEED